MKAIRKINHGYGANLVNIPVPEAGDHDLLVKIDATALCKSDVDVYEWTDLVKRANYKLPFTMGHEFSGTVVEVGKAVKNFKKGDRVAGETHIPCGYCHSCRTDNQHICSNNMGVLGRNVDGSFAEYIKLPDILAIKLHENIKSTHGSLLEQLATELHALSKIQPSGKSVAILGTGTIGQMAVELAKTLGALKVFAVDINDNRLEESRKKGADIIINGMKEDFVQVIKEETDGIGVRAVVELTGNQKVINQAVDALQIAGKMVQVGMVEGPLTFNNYMYKVVYKELVMTGIFGRRMFDTWETLIDILETEKINLDGYIGAEIPMDEYEKGIELFTQVNGRVIMFP